MRDAQTAYGRNVLKTSGPKTRATLNRRALREIGAPFFVFGGHARRKVKNEKPEPNNSKTGSQPFRAGLNCAAPPELKSFEKGHGRDVPNSTAKSLGSPRHKRRDAGNAKNPSSIEQKGAPRNRGALFVLRRAGRSAKRGEK